MKISKRAYTAEFKGQAVKRSRDRPAIAAVWNELCLNDRTLCNRIKASATGKPNGADRGFTAGDARVEKRMREHGIYVCHKRCYQVTRDSKHGLPVAAKLFARNLTAAVLNQVWAPDITYLRTDESWLYVPIVVELFNREVIGWSPKPRMTADIVTNDDGLALDRELSISTAGPMNKMRPSGRHKAHLPEDEIPRETHPHRKRFSMEVWLVNAFDFSNFGATPRRAGR